jgi:lysophospholipase L1-like esterase
MLAGACAWSGGVSAVTLEAACTSPKANVNYRNNSPYKANDSSSDITWRVRYNRLSNSVNADIDVVALEKKVGSGSWTSANTEIWQLQLGARGEIDGNPLRGNLTALQLFDGFQQPLKANNGGIRLVAPDGGCAVQLAYPDGENAQPFSTIAVVGDSLTNDVVVANLKSYAQQANANWRVHVDAQNGSRWANYDDTRNNSQLDQSGQSQLDELRGVAPYVFHNRALVVALGSNDIFYINGSSARADEVRNSIHNVMKELMQVPTCVVLVSPPASTYIPQFNADADIGAWIYAMMALGAVEGVDPAKVRVVDFGAASKSHSFSSADPWFILDTLHLNVPGSQNYARMIIDGVKSCYN